MTSEKQNLFTIISIMTTISMMASPENWMYFLHTNPPPGSDFEEGERRFAIMVFYRERGQVPSSMEEVLGDHEIVKIIENMKTNMRNMITGAASSPGQNRVESESNKWKEEERREREKQANMHRAGMTIKARMEPAQEGTVDELAKRYNKSKSEIRRLKRDGLLHTLQQCECDLT